MKLKVVYRFGFFYTNYTEKYGWMRSEYTPTTGKKLQMALNYCDKIALTWSSFSSSLTGKRR